MNAARSPARLSTPAEVVAILAGSVVAWLAVVALVVTLFLTVFIDLIGFGMVIPFLSFYAREYGASGVTVGAVVGIYSIMQFFFAPVWGRLSDRIGRRPVILISLTASFIGYLLFGLAQRRRLDRSRHSPTHSHTGDHRSQGYSREAC